MWFRCSYTPLTLKVSKPEVWRKKMHSRMIFFRWLAATRVFRFFLLVSFCLPNWDLYNSVVYFVIFSFFIPTPASFLKRISPELRLCFKSMSLYFCLYFYRRKMSAAVSSQPSGCRNEKKIVFFLLATSPSLRRHLVAPSSEKLRILKRFPFLL